MRSRGTKKPKDESFHLILVLSNVGLKSLAALGRDRRACLALQSLMK